MTKYKNKRNEKEKPDENLLREAIEICEGNISEISRWLKTKHFCLNRKAVENLIDIYNLTDDLENARDVATEDVIKSIYDYAREGEGWAANIISKTRGHRVGFMHGETEAIVKKMYSTQESESDGESLEQRLKRADENIRDSKGSKSSC